MKAIDLTEVCSLLDEEFGNTQRQVRVAFLLLATSVSAKEIGETSVISNITDQKTLLRVINDLKDAVQLRKNRAAGQA